MTVDLRVEQGGVTAIIGPNGAGKTTLFHLISGFQQPDEGRIEFDGEDITGLPPERIAARGLIRTFQLVQLFRDLTVIENVKVGAHLHTRGGVLTALLRPKGARRAEAQVDADGARAPCLRRARCLRRSAGRRADLWPAAAARDRARAGGPTQASAARRAGGRTQSGGNEAALGDHPQRSWRKAPPCC